MEILNTIETFGKGFKIERNGEIITLTPEEMSDFRYLEKAKLGKECLECYKEICDEKDLDIIDEMMNDEEVCFNIEDNILENALQEITIFEHDVIEEYIEKWKR